MKVGGVYIPPEDSPYFNSSQHGTLEAHTHTSDNIIVLGDFNGRVGTPHIVKENGETYQYNSVNDVSVNNHGRAIVNMCNNNDMVIVNNLKYDDKQYNGQLTFKRRDKWLSEILICAYLKVSL